MCTAADHHHAREHAWDSLVNPRPWHDAGLEIAECPMCASTIARELTRTLQDLLAERRALVQELRAERHEPARKVMQAMLDVLDEEIAARRSS